MLSLIINFGIRFFGYLKKHYLISIFFIISVNSFALSDADELLEKAEYFYLNGKFTLALNSYQELYKKFPYYFSMSDVICRIVEVEVRLGRHQEAIVIFNRDQLKYSNSNSTRKLMMKKSL